MKVEEHTHVKQFRGPGLGTVVEGPNHPQVMTLELFERLEFEGDRGNRLEDNQLRDL
ncbi:hypothetical protein KIN20_001671 [Parelaphostrongylus tenuis]|uniref:Uncharacterized protein n=1 Tax=Parelaphostrongylus tenuis TaxID=148309 RepID=A0AAD5LYN9_PARTN|nr:hypothetical protein KIN20_001671 [Parelaphostrongylus tenuis]